MFSLFSLFTSQFSLPPHLTGPAVGAALHLAQRQPVLFARDERRRGQLHLRGGRLQPRAPLRALPDLREHLPEHRGQPGLGARPPHLDQLPAGLSQPQVAAHRLQRHHRVHRRGLPHSRLQVVPRDRGRALPAPEEGSIELFGLNC